MKKILLPIFITCSFILAFTSLKADDGYKITIKLANQPYKMAFLANYYGDKKYIKDTAFVQPGENIVFSGKEKLPGGIYMFVTPSMKYFEILITDEQNFTMETDTTDFIGKMKVKGSKANTEFYDYLHFTNRKGMLIDSLSRAYGMQKTKRDSVAVQKRVAKEDSLLRNYRTDFVKKNPTQLLSKIFRAMPEPEVPEFPRLPNGRRDSTAAFNYFKSHYFDNVDFSDERLLRTPIFQGKIDKYLNQLTVQDPDSIIKSADVIVGKAKANPEMFKYCVWYLTNTYETSKVMGFEAVFVHMAKEYYATGQTTWLDSAKVRKVVDRAKLLDPLLLHKKVADLILQDSLYRNYHLYDVKTDYTVLYFFNSTCGHCIKETPILWNEYDSLLRHQYSLTILPITEEKHTKDDPNMKNWHKFMKDHAKWDWLWLYDRYNQYNWKTMFDVYATPKIFVLDKNKEIIAKGIGVEQLGEVLDKYTKMMADKKKTK